MSFESTRNKPEREHSRQLAGLPRVFSADDEIISQERVLVGDVPPTFPLAGASVDDEYVDLTTGIVYRLVVEDRDG